MKRVGDWRWDGGGHTLWVITMEQTIQARRLRCWPGGTKFSVIMACNGFSLGDQTLKSRKDKRYFSCLNCCKVSSLACKV